MSHFGVKANVIVYSKQKRAYLELYIDASTQQEISQEAHSAPGTADADGVYTSNFLTAIDTFRAYCRHTMDEYNVDDMDKFHHFVVLFNQAGFDLKFRVAFNDPVNSK